MTRIDFHSNVGDSIAYACRLVRKAYLSGQPLIVLAEPERLKRFDEQLWTFKPLEFVPIAWRTARWRLKRRCC